MNEIEQIFISYRRKDGFAAASVQHIKNRLSSEFKESNIFLDDDSIPVGVDFAAYIDAQIEKSDVLLAIIGPEWLTILKERERELSDYLRRELEAALDLGIPIIPILVGDADLPEAEQLAPTIQSLSRLNAFRLDTRAGFDHDMDTLIQELGNLPNEIKRLERNGTRNLSTDEVFPLHSGPVPHTYVIRKKAEKVIKAHLKLKNSIIHLSGPSKSGKTLLINRIDDPLPKLHIHVWPNQSAEDFWADLNARLNVKESNMNNPKISVLDYLRRNPHTIIIDDFHWFDVNLVPHVFPPLKEVINLGSKLILVSVSNNTIFSIGDLADFAGRVLNVEMPPWDSAEIKEIGKMGFKKLNVKVDKGTLANLTTFSYFSPLLMQGLCNRYCVENRILKSQPRKLSLPEMDRDHIGKLVARFARPLTTVFDRIFSKQTSGKWPAKPKDGRDLSLTEIFILSISHTRPFDPITLKKMEKRTMDRILLAKGAPQNLPALFAKEALRIQRSLGGANGDRSPIFYDSENQTVTVVDPYFKLWMRWVHGPSLGGNLFPD